MRSRWIPQSTWRTLEPILDERRFTLDQIVDAHRYMEGNTQFGKIVVDVET